MALQLIAPFGMSAWEEKGLVTKMPNDREFGSASGESQGRKRTR